MMRSDEQVATRIDDRISNPCGDVAGAGKGGASLQGIASVQNDEIDTGRTAAVVR